MQMSKPQRWHLIPQALGNSNVFLLFFLKKTPKTSKNLTILSYLSANSCFIQIFWAAEMESSNVMTFSSFSSFWTVFLRPPTARSHHRSVAKQFWLSVGCHHLPRHGRGQRPGSVTGCSCKRVGLPPQRNWAAARQERFAAVPRLTPPVKPELLACHLGGGVQDDTEI